MPSVWGEALMSLGQSLPKIGYAFDEAKEKERKKKIEDEERERENLLFQQALKGQDLQNQINEMRISGMQDIEGKKKEAEKNYLDYLQDYKDSKRIPELTEAGPSPQHERLTKLEEFGGMTPSQQLEEYDLIRGAEYSPGVARKVTGVLKEDQAKKKAENSLKLKSLESESDLNKLLLQSSIGSAENRRKEQARLELEREKMKGRSELEKQKLESKGTVQKKLEFKNKLIEQIQTVMNHPAKYSGVSFGRLAALGPTESRDFKRQVEKLKSMTTLENLKYLKGAMSDKDVKFIQEASTALDLGGKMEALNRELNKMYKSVTGGTQQTPQEPITQPGGYAQPQTQEEYDALPSGALFIDPDDGKTYRKP